MKISELLDTKRKVEIVKDTERAYYGRAEFNGVPIEFRLDRWPNDPKDGRWQFTFVAIGDEFDDGETYHKTGQGDELAVFATAKNFVDDFLKTVKPIALYFEADKLEGDSRSKLYNRFISRWTPAGYEHDRVYSDLEMDYHAFFRKQ